MGLLKCDVCGGKIIVKEGGQIGECECCGANYTLERMREIASGVKVSVTGSKEDVEQWKALVKKYLNAGDFGAVESVVKKILGAVPSDEYANDIYSKLQDWKFCEIRNGVLVKYTGKAEHITIPDCVTSIGSNAFYDCRSLTSVSIPDSVKEIGYLAFYDCRSLTSVSIPDSVTSIGNEAFKRCCSLNKVNITDLAKWCEFDFNNYSTNPLCYANNLYLNNVLVTELTIPDGVTSIGRAAFFGCKSLTSVTIPDSVTSIGRKAFSCCTSLTSVTIPDSVTTIGDYVFRDCTNLSRIIVHNNPNVTVNNFEGTLWYNMRERRQRGVCQHCGGEFKGIFNKVCSKCGKPKDY